MQRSEPSQLPIDARHAPAGGQLRPRVAIGCVVLTVLATLHTAPLRAGPRDDSWVRLHLDTLLTALTYERNLQESARAAPFRIGILFDRELGASRTRAERIVAELARISRHRTFLGRQIEVLRVPLTDATTLKARLRAGLSVLYFVDGISDDAVRTTVALTRDLEVISVTGVERYVTALGVTLAVVRSAETPLVINYPASLEESACFAAGMLKLARVIGWRQGLPPCRSRLPGRSTEPGN